MLKYMFGFTKFHSNIDVYHEIVDKKQPWDPKDFTYLITGRPGPTGKSWLAARLNEAGFRAVDMTDVLYSFVNFENVSGNYWHVDETNKVVYIILNDVNDIYLVKKEKPDANS